MHPIQARFFDFENGWDDLRVIYVLGRVIYPRFIEERVVSGSKIGSRSGGFKGKLTALPPYPLMGTSATREC